MTKDEKRWAARKLSDYEVRIDQLEGRLASARQAFRLISKQRLQSLILLGMFDATVVEQDLHAKIEKAIFDD